MTAQLKLIEAQCPAWATLREVNGALEIAAQITRSSGRTDAPVHLNLTSSHGKLSVRERAPRQWPVACPERHINRNGTFCLGVGDPVSPKDAKHANAWWRWLNEFIECQRVAADSGCWPSTRALHHGDAYKYQRKMEDLAAGTIFEQDVRRALEAAQGWLLGDIPRLSKDRKRLVNLRAPCPRGCLRRRKPILRRNCDHKELMFDLVKNEWLRRKEESDFWNIFEGQQCCETMRDCPLRKENK